MIVYMPLHCISLCLVISLLLDGSQGVLVCLDNSLNFRFRNHDSLTK